MATADVVVLPSYYREGVPRSLIEAAAAGLPIVTTDAPGCREVVQDGVNGFLVPVRDAAAVAAAIRKLVLDPALAARMGAAGRKIALAQFDERIVLMDTLAVYRELCPDSSQHHFRLTLAESRNPIILRLNFQESGSRRWSAQGEAWRRDDVYPPTQYV